MRILHIDPDDMDSPVSGGDPVRTFEIYRRLAKRHDITVLTPSFARSTKEKIREGIRYVRIGRKYGRHNSTYFISFYLAAPFAARRFDCDLLVEDLMPPTAATITPLINPKKIIASVQWFWPKAWADQYKIPFHWYLPFGLKQYRHFIALTHRLKQELLKYNPRADIEVIPNGVTDHFLKQPPQKGEFILYLGRIEDMQKGTDLLIQAFHTIVHKTNVKLVIAGDGIDFEKTKSTVRNLGMQDRIVFEGKVGMERKLDLLSRCLFVCIPSRIESFCMVALEAFACAKTIVFFDIPYMAFPHVDFAIKIRPFDIDQFASAMLHLLNHPEKAEAFGEKARQYALNCTWDSLALAQEAFYKKVLTGNSKASR